MKVSTRGDYAARALLSLALHGSDRPTSVKEIAERTGLPQPYLEQILLAVKGAGLVRSKRGVGGGYVLARPPEEITLADILAAVDGPLTTLLGEHDHCEGHCMLQEVWVGVSDETRQILERFTLAELVDRTRIGHPDVVDRGGARSRRRGRRELTGTRRPPGRGSASIRTTTSSPPPADGAERDVTAVTHHELAHDREPEAEVTVGRPSRRASPDCQNRSNARARSSADIPGPSSLTRSSTQSPRSAATTRTALPGGRHLERVVQEVVDDLLEPPRRRATPPACPPPTASMCTCFSAANASQASHRPSMHVLDRRSAPDRRRRLLGPREHEQAVDEPRQPRHLGERALEVFGGGAVARRPRGSRAAAAARRAACAAGATRRRRSRVARPRAARGAPRSR